MLFRLGTVSFFSLTAPVPFAWVSLVFFPKWDAPDLYHNAVKSALIKEDWVIVADPYRIQYKDVDLYADLAAERPIAAEREGQKIVVEIKSFVGRSLMSDFHNAVGQYTVYRSLIQATEPEYQLYSATL